MKPSPRRSLQRLTAFAQRIEHRLTLPVVIAVCASVPAVFLTIWQDGEFVLAGTIIGWSAGAILWAESVILLLAAENKLDWLKRHKWLLVIGALTLISLVVAAGGAQLLRLLRVIGSLRILRAKRIISAAQILDRRLGFGNFWWRSAVFTAAGLIAAVFVAVVLADPTSQHVQLLSWFNENMRVVPVLLAGVILAVATWLVVRNRSEDKEEEEE
ncbi:hypothetical protein [Glycomyces xiaoerkulensis]|uniref:hypothetical protein n=1 Tax=Glycomyces xiaoerkulensis TaxID=2038139 RepID=UPI000C256BBA|nr:hypothetical protein [Glycomyces xiaoerkulensis]